MFKPVSGQANFAAMEEETLKFWEENHTFEKSLENRRGAPEFIFYALGYAMERVLSMSQTGISAFIPTKVKSQQINLFEYFKIGDCECSTF